MAPTELTTAAIITTGPHTDSADGHKRFEVPPGLLFRNFYPSEDELRKAILGPSHEWAQQLQQDQDGSAKYEVDSDDETQEELHEITKNAMSEITWVKHLGLLKLRFPTFSSSIAAFVAQGKLRRKSPAPHALEEALTNAANKGPPKLQEAMSSQRTSSQHNGFSGNNTEMVEFPISTERGGRWETKAIFGEYAWEVRDRGDQLHRTQVSPKLADGLNSASIAKTSVRSRIFPLVLNFLRHQTVHPPHAPTLPNGEAR